MLPVVASQPRTESSNIPRSSPFLQTYDIFSGQHVSRQALTRNLATTINIGPEGIKLSEPDTKLMQLSPDGEWLATVDEWQPPKLDVEFLTTEEAQQQRDEQDLRREVYLRFWRWHADASEWGLVTRIDDTHLTRHGSRPGRILDLVADPSGTGFATTGEDGFVRVWRPKTRLRDGRTVRGTKGEGLVNWSQAWEFEAERQVEALEADADVAVGTLPTNAKLAWSLDGSLIAASFEVTGRSSGNIEFIDAFTGTLKASRPGWYGTGLCALGLVDRYLVILSDELYVWDVVNDKLSYAFAIEYPLNLKREHKAQMAHLAVDQMHGTFAIAVPERKNPSRMASTVI
ncbi:hypothetical protein LTS18_014748, partial [Coniosporium uncinatum]